MNSFPLIIVDESTDARIAQALVTAGYNIFSIQQMMQGIADRDVVKVSLLRDGFILTEDKDFGDEIVFRKEASNGALLLRLAGVDINEKIRLVINALEKHGDELIGAFSVLTFKKLRIRK